MKKGYFSVRESNDWPINTSYPTTEKSGEFQDIIIVLFDLEELQSDSKTGVANLQTPQSEEHEIQFSVLGLQNASPQESPDRQSINNFI